MQKNNLYVDMHNLAWMTRFSRLTTPKSKFRKDPHAKELIMVEMMRGIIQQASKLRATGVILCLEGGTFRRSIYPDYKNKMEEPDIYSEEVNRAEDECANFFKENTAALVLRVGKAEGDDLIAHGIQRTSPEIHSTILSNDNDFVQLLSDRVKLYSLTQKKFRETDDPQFDLFMKCIRGDSSDLIPSAFKGVRKIRLEAAWNDPVEMINLLEEQVQISPTETVKVEQLLDRNFKLIDLTMQPEWLKQSMETAYTTTPTGRYQPFKIPKILREEYRLGDQFVTMFDGYERPFLKAPVF